MFVESAPGVPRRSTTSEPSQSMGASGESARGALSPEEKNAEYVAIGGRWAVVRVVGGCCGRDNEIMRCGANPGSSHNYWAMSGRERRVMKSAEITTLLVVVVDEEGDEVVGEKSSVMG